MQRCVQEIVRIQGEFGLRTKHGDPWVIERHARLSWDNTGREVHSACSPPPPVHEWLHDCTCWGQNCEGKNVQLFVESLNARSCSRAEVVAIHSATRECRPSICGVIPVC